MKHFHRALAVFFVATLFPALLASFAAAQTLPTFQHIIIVIQENRTPDNLFGAGPAKGYPCTTEESFEPGVDIEAGGYGYVELSNGQTQRQVICDTPVALSGWNASLSQPIDPDHTYDPGWMSDYDSGNLDGFCHEYNNPNYVGVCPSYAYVQRSDVQPYFDIATNYGFANYMFQTNEGPSAPAHQFLFTGTSAPVAPNDLKGFYLDFVSENLAGNGFNYSGCPYTGTYGWPRWTLPDGSEEADPRGTSASECYPHDSLVTAAADCNPTNNCDRGLVSWAYYNTLYPKTGTTQSIVWDATIASPEVCYGALSGSGNCTGPEYTNHVKLPATGGYSDAPIFDDLYNCNLPQVSWVIPDGVWSDHPLTTITGPTTVYGPSWVGDIIDAVGAGMTGSTCNGPGSGRYWTTEPTLVLVVWDDWGGWFDHVPPPQVYRSPNKTSCPTTSAPNGWGCGYVYGFRVPLLVVSPYTSAGYVSGACQPSCTNDKFPTNTTSAAS
jgi:phospholipase C